MSRRLVLFVLAMSVSALQADDKLKPNTLSPKEIEEGWILLFDGETTYGWKTEGDVKIENRELHVGGPMKCEITDNSSFGASQICFEYSLRGKAGITSATKTLNLKTNPTAADHWFSAIIDVKANGSLSESWTELSSDASVLPGIAGANVTKTGDSFSFPAPIQFAVEPDSKLSLRSIKLKPTGAKPLFNGKDLEGWKVFPGDKYKSKFTVTPEGWINVKNGPGDLQTTGQYADFLLQLECISNGKALNSGLFFRCIANEYQNGYEAQIHNGYKDNDRSKPADFGTGAIYRRIPARKVVPNDHEWFTMTVLAQGKHLATWVNGYQTVDWTDERPANKNPRNGAKTEAGHLSIQGHDPTTDLNFRNIRIVEFKSEKK
jgi:hypothetical protein